MWLHIPIRLQFPHTTKPPPKYTIYSISARTLHLYVFKRNILATKCPHLTYSIRVRGCFSHWERSFLPLPRPAHPSCCCPALLANTLSSCQVYCSLEPAKQAQQKEINIYISLYPSALRMTCGEPEKPTFSFGIAAYGGAEPCQENLFARGNSTPGSWWRGLYPPYPNIWKVETLHRPFWGSG